MSNKKMLALVGLVALSSLAFAGVATTQASQGNGFGRWGMGMMGRGNVQFQRPVAVGSVTAINGTTITLRARDFGPKAHNGTGTNAVTTTTYTVDASHATITKDNATATISNIAVGDVIMVQGTLNGTTITATTIRDGKMHGRMNGRGQDGNALGSIVGNGQPVIAGTISAINGSTLTITNKSNVTYSVDASNAKITQGPTTITLTNVKVGDTVVVQGTVNGTSVVASTIIDQTRPVTTTGGRHGFFGGGIRGFFMHLFGF